MAGRKNAPSANRRLVAEREFILESGNRAVVRLYDDENTVPKSDTVRHRECVERMKDVAAEIFRNAELRERENGA